MNINDTNVEFQNSINDISLYLDKSSITPGGPPQVSQIDLIHQIYSRLQKLHNEIQMRTEYDPGNNPGEINPVILKNLNKLCERLKTISSSEELSKLANTISNKIRGKLDTEKYEGQDFDTQLKSEEAKGKSEEAKGKNEEEGELEAWRLKDEYDEASRAFSPSSLFSSRLSDEPSWSDYSPSPTSNDEPSPTSSEIFLDEKTEKERDSDSP